MCTQVSFPSCTIKAYHTVHEMLQSPLPSMSVEAIATPVPATASATESMMVVVTTKRVYHVSRDKLMEPVQETNPAASSELILCTSRDKLMEPVQETNPAASSELVLSTGSAGKCMEPVQETDQLASGELVL